LDFRDDAEAAGQVVPVQLAEYSKFAPRTRLDAPLTNHASALAKVMLSSAISFIPVTSL
jgi:hypothetical protein